jgi:hypothetical protein
MHRLTAGKYKNSSCTSTRIYQFPKQVFFIFKLSHMKHQSHRKISFYVFSLSMTCDSTSVRVEKNVPWWIHFASEDPCHLGATGSSEYFAPGKSHRLRALNLRFGRPLRIFRSRHMQHMAPSSSSLQSPTGGVSRVCDSCIR